jgi:uncharacterized protein YecE (DUF72 family)
MLREHGIAAVIAADSKYPQIADLTAPFVYARIMGTQPTEASGYSDQSLDAWAARARAWALGLGPEGLEYVEPHPDKGTPRDVYLYVISGHKVHNPAAAMSMIRRLR